MLGTAPCDPLLTLNDSTPRGPSGMLHVAGENAVAAMAGGH